MQNYGRWLWLFAGLFALRVIAQPLALVVDARLLPRFESWHSGLLPYPWLLASQLAILGWLVMTARRVARGAASTNRTLGCLLIGVAGIYGLAMLTRLLLGATLLREARFFTSPVPTVFHLVLAGYLFVYGHFHYRRA